MLLPSKLGAETVLTPGGQRDSSQLKRFAVVHTRPWPRGPDPPSTARGRVGRVPPTLSGGYTSVTIRIAGDGVVRCGSALLPRCDPDRRLSRRKAALRGPRRHRFLRGAARRAVEDFQPLRRDRPTVADPPRERGL